MITDQSVLANLIAEWNFVRRSQKMVTTNTLGAFAQGAIQTSQFTDFCHNLVLIQAYSVLNDILLQFRDEGQFACKGRELGLLMNASKSVLPWCDFAVVAEGKDRRNDIAHRSAVIPRADCWKYMDAIERELLAWRVILKAPDPDYTITVGAAQRP